jgi:hypothetical protein
LGYKLVLEADWKFEVVQANQTAFLVNGVTLRDERDNTPFTGISYSAIDEFRFKQVDLMQNMGTLDRA